MKPEDQFDTPVGTMKTSPENVILYDGVCNLCWFWVQFVLKRDKRRVFHFLPLQSETAQNLLREQGLQLAELSTVILIDGSECFIRSSAILQIFKKLPLPWPLLYGLIALPVFIRDGVYRFIGRNRYKWFGRGQSCYLPDKDDQDRFL